MIVCEACKLTFESNPIFIRHVHLTHSASNIFRCAESNCKKSFASLGSFVKHRRAKHLGEGESLTSVLDSSSFRLETDFDDFSELNKDVPSTFFHEDSSNSLDSNSLPEDDLLWDDEDFQYSSNFSQSTSKNILNSPAVNFVGKLYQYPDLPRTRVNSIISEASDLFKSTLSSIQHDVCRRLQALGAGDEYVSDIQEIFNKYSEPFENMKTEKQRFSSFKNLDTFIVPTPYKLGERTEFKSTPTETSREQIPVVAQYIPARRTLKKFFELPGVYDETMKYVDTLNSRHEIISNIIQCPFWKEKTSSCKNKTVLPLLMYFDDYENNNPLGSHKGVSKCGAVYLSVPCLPPEYQSKIENIFLFILFNSLDRTTFKNSIIFEKVVRELQFLKDEGITIELPTGNHKIYFDLSLIIGDNLGLHSILGFVESFRANKFCRFCLTESKNINKIYRESDCTLRDVSNYDNLLSLNDPALSGIKYDCIFNKIQGFHVTNNPAVDVMHDLLEGVCRYDLALLLHHFIYVRKFLTLDHLNIKIRSFYYGAKNSSNKPPEILESHLKNKCIMLSSAEMLNLVKNLNLIIGLSVAPKDEHWDLLLTLQEIIQIVCSTKITKETPDILELTIADYLTKLNEKFPNSTKPKHHFLVHYPSMMRKVGPLWNLCCMRFESKHREGKQISRSAISRVNVCKTIALRHQLIFNYRLLCKNSKYPTFVCSSVKSVAVKKLPDISCFVELLPNHLLDGNIFLTNSIQFSGQTIKKNSVVVTSSELGPEFYIVKLIILNGDDDFFLVTRQMADVYLNQHVRAYKMYSTEDFHWEIIKKVDMVNAFISYTNKLSDGYYYIAKHWI